IIATNSSAICVEICGRTGMQPIAAYKMVANCFQLSNKQYNAGGERFFELLGDHLQKSGVANARQVVQETKQSISANLQRQQLANSAKQQLAALRKEQQEISQWVIGMDRCLTNNLSELVDDIKRVLR